MPIIKSKFLLEREKNQKLESGQVAQAVGVGRKPDPASARPMATKQGAGAAPAKAEPCPTCGCGVQWQDRRGQRHCRGCDDYLSRRQVDSFWLLIQVDGTNDNEAGADGSEPTTYAWQQRDKATFEPIQGPPPGFTVHDWDLHRLGQFEDHERELWDFWTEERLDPATGQPVRWQITQRAGIKFTPPGLSYDIFTGEFQEFDF